MIPYQIINKNNIFESITASYNFTDKQKMADKPILEVQKC